MPGNWNKIGNISGRDGKGVPAGGTKGQVLLKTGGTDFATAWGKLRYEELDGVVPASALPQISIEPYVVASEEAMLLLPAVAGRMAIRTDVGKTFVLADDDPSVLANWVELRTASDVVSVAGKQGVVTLSKGDVGLDQVDNTADADKPLATTDTPGLMSPDDRATLDESTSVKTPDTLVLRDADGRTQVEAPSDSYDAANKGYVDAARVDAIAQADTATEDKFSKYMFGGLSTGAPSNWNLTNIPRGSWVIDSAKPIGSPLAGKADMTQERNKIVWLLDNAPLGLGYVKQRATILYGLPKYITGFTWERFYTPANGTWSEWSCVAGDTGWLPSTESGQPVGESNPFIISGFVSYYSGASYVWARRTAETIRLVGTLTIKGDSQAQRNKLDGYTEGVHMGWFTTAEPHFNTFWAPGDAQSRPVACAGSGDDKWVAYWALNSNLYGNRFGPGSPGVSVWLPFNLSWPEWKAA